LTAHKNWERCNLKLHKVENPFPEFAVPRTYDRQLFRAGVPGRVEEAPRHSGAQLELRGVLRTPPMSMNPVELEIGIIKQMSYSGYFLIVWTSSSMRGTMEFRWAGQRLGTGSLVAYAMEITNIDPMQNVLLFERSEPER